MGRAESIRRVQIGTIGLLSVLLLVGVANMALNRVSDEKPVTDEIPGAAMPMDPATASDKEAPNEPLAEIGLTPAPAANDADAGKAPAASR